MSEYKILVLKTNKQANIYIYIYIYIYILVYIYTKNTKKQKKLNKKYKVAIHEKKNILEKLLTNY